MHFQDMSFFTALEGISPWEVMGTSGSSFHSISSVIPESAPMPRGSAWPDDIIICRCYSLQGQVIHILHLKAIFQLRPNGMTFAEWTKLKSTRIYWAGNMWPGLSVMSELRRKTAWTRPQRRSQYSLADEMKTKKTIREFYGHSHPPVVLLCAQHLDLLFYVWGVFHLLNLDEK